MAFRILLIDNYDSYTYSLHHLIATACGVEPLTIHNADAFASWAEVRSALPPFDAVVISPGPGHPDTEEKRVRVTCAAIEVNYRAGRYFRSSYILFSIPPPVNL